jgi:hypothetical protein
MAVRFEFSRAYGDEPQNRGTHPTFSCRCAHARCARQIFIHLKLCYLPRMQAYRFHWLVYLVVAACLAAGATVRTADLQTLVSSQTEVRWDSQTGAAILTRSAPALLARSAPEPEPDNLASADAALPRARQLLASREADWLPIRCATAVQRASAYLEQTNDRPRAPPRTEAA